MFKKAGTLLLGLWFSHSFSQRSSGMGTRASLGSMVQKGKFSAAACDLVRTLKKVDLPTLGRPTMPIFRLVPRRPNSFSGFSTSLTFLGGILDLARAGSVSST